MEFEKDDPRLQYNVEESYVDFAGLHVKKFKGDPIVKIQSMARGYLAR